MKCNLDNPAVWARGGWYKDDTGRWFADGNDFDDGWWIF